MKKHLGKKILGTVLASAMVVGLASSSSALAAGAAVSTTGDGKVYSPKDIIDVVVPTKFTIAMNPLKVAVASSETNLSGNSQILSGTYLIENRSTVPVSIKMDLTVAAGTGGGTPTTADLVTAEDLKAASTAAMFSLDMTTTAAGAAQNPVAQPTAKADGSTADMRADAAMENVKLSKASAQNMKVTELAGKANTKLSATFWLNKGPYTAKFDKDSDTVKYDIAANAAYDGVGFTFTGTTTTNLANWAKVTKAPSVTATYTLTQSTDAVYAATGTSPIWKGVALAATDAKETIKETKAATDTTPATYTTTFATGTTAIKLDKAVAVPKKNEKQSDGTVTQVNNFAGVAVTVLSLQPDKKSVKTTIDNIVASTSDLSLDAYNKFEEYKIDAAKFAALELVKGTPLPKGYYQVTVGTNNAIVLYQ